MPDLRAAVADIVDDIAESWADRPIRPGAANWLRAENADHVQQILDAVAEWLRSEADTHDTNRTCSPNVDNWADQHAADVLRRAADNLQEHTDG